MEDEETIDRRSLRSPTRSGCLVMSASAALSCILLFLNGGVVMALVNALDDRGYSSLRDDRISQFIVLIGPVLLLVIQWMMIDYLWARVHRQK